MARHIGRKELDTLVRVHLPALLRFAVRLTGSIHDGEDSVQEALLRISTSWKQLQKTDAFKSWSFQILVNVVRDQHRRAIPEPVSLSSPGSGSDGWNAEGSTIDVEDEAASGTEITELAELREEIEAKLRMLPPRQREVLALLAFEPYTPQEVAHMLEIEVGNVYATLRVARLRLRQLLSLPESDGP